MLIFYTKHGDQYELETDGTGPTGTQNLRT